MRSRDDEFYVGYLSQAPAGIRAWVRRAVAVILGVGAGVALVLGGMQRGFAPAIYEYGKTRSLEGILSADPYPTLVVPRPGKPSEGSGSSRYLLVSRGKFGASHEVNGLVGHRVRLLGTLIYREGRTMIQVEHGSIVEEGVARSDAATAGGRIERLGPMTLVGEIVDSKCFMGVMNPGNLKVHRACAVRCIGGGIPPLFVVHDRTGRTVQLLLVSSSGRMVNREVLDMVAEPLEIEGEVERHYDILVFKADPATYRRLP